MNRYLELLERVLAQAANPDEAFRRSVYERALQVARAQLSGKLDEAAIERELAQVNGAILEIERRYATADAGRAMPVAAPDDAASVAPPPAAEQTAAVKPATPEDRPRPPITEFVAPEEYDDMTPADRDVQEERSLASNPLLILLTIFLVSATGLALYLRTPNDSRITARLSGNARQSPDLPKGVSDRSRLAAGKAQFGASITDIDWVLETRTPKSSDYFLARQVIATTARFAGDGLEFTVALRRQSGSSGKKAFAIDVRYDSKRDNARQVLKMFMPQVELEKSKDATELNGVVIRLGINGFMANLQEKDSENAFNPALLQKSVRLRIPFLMDDGKNHTLVADLPANFFATLERLN